MAYAPPPSDAAPDTKADASDETPVSMDAAYGPPPDAVGPDDAQGEEASPMMDGAYAPPPQ
jgi:hypothetical protein